MKKHFLILMLMALLPLAGWAADLSKGTIVVPSVYYGQQPNETTISVANEAGGVVPVTSYDFAGYFSDAACTTEVTKAQIAAASVGTTFYAKVTGKNGYENSLIGSFEVQRMSLNLYGTPGTKVYGTAEDGDIYTVSSVTDANGTSLTTTFTGKFTFTRASGANVGVYAISATISDTELAKNYTVESTKIYVSGTTPAKYSITAKEFKAANITIDPIAAVDYAGGAELKPAVVVKDVALNATVSADDYTVVYSSNTDAGTGTVSITGKRNYTSDGLSPLTATFTINKATAMINATATKDYNGNNNIPTTGTGRLTYTYQGAPSDISVTIASGYIPTTDAPAVGTVGTYGITIDPTKFTSTNYTFVANKGVFTINQIGLTATADDKSYSYGDAEAYTVSLSGNLTADADNIQNAIKVTKATEASTDGSYALTPSFKTDAEIEATVDISDARKTAIDGDASITDKAAKKAEEKAALQTAAKNMVKNYNLTAVAGKLTYTKASLKIALDESKFTLTKVYDGLDASIATLTSDNVLVIGKKNESDVVDLSGLTATITPIGGSIKNQGTYQIVLAGAKADNYTITYINSVYKINKKDLKVKLATQTFIKDQTATLNTTAYTIDEEKGLATTDKASEVFKVQFNATATGKLSTDGKFTTAETINPGIEIVNCGATASKWANYNVTTEGGKVVVTAASAITLDDSKDLTTVLTADKAGATVTFSARAINAEQWNVVVLPFEVPVKALSEALGYAVIDVLDENASDGNVHFKLKVAGTIAANTPMLVYPSGEIINMNEITIPSVNVKKVTGNVSVSDASGNKFIGTYKTTGIYGEDFRYLSKGAWYDASNYTEASPANIKPLRGYLDMTGNANAARALIFIDEPDGTTTAIQAVSSDKIGSDVKADGWYTIGGMKLQGAPTQKGIYINNGKKIIVK